MITYNMKSLNKKTIMILASFIMICNCSIGGTIYVINHGATGNGVTDDTAAIQAAINAGSAGDKIYFDAGTYIISSRINVEPGITLSGPTWAGLVTPPVAHEAIIKWKSTAITDSFMLDLQTNSNINNIELNGNDKVTGGIEINYGDHNMTIEDVHLHNFYGSSTKMACGIFIPNTCYDIDIITCKIEHVNSTNDGIMNNTSGTARAILMQKVTDIKIHGNFLGKMPSEESDVIQLGAHAEDYDAIHGIEITNNCIYDYRRRGLKIQGSNVLIKYNYFSNNGSSRNAIEVFGNSCEILNNTFVIQSTWSAVEINGNNNEVKNNNIWIYGNSYTGDDGFGVLSWTRAIYINGGNDNLIDNNVIPKSYYGIYLYNADNNIITNNDITAKDSWIYRRGSSSNNTVSGNTRSNINF